LFNGSKSGGFFEKSGTKNEGKILKKVICCVFLKVVVSGEGRGEEIPYLKKPPP